MTKCGLETCFYQAKKFGVCSKHSKYAFLAEEIIPFQEVLYKMYKKHLDLFVDNNIELIEKSEQEIVKFCLENEKKFNKHLIFNIHTIVSHHVIYFGCCRCEICMLSNL